MIVFGNMGGETGDFLFQELSKVSLPESVVLVRGGDGTMLAAVKEHGPEHTYFGLNFGHLGFLMNSVPKADPQRLLRSIREGHYRIREYPMLQVEVAYESGATETLLAVNDVYIERQEQTAHLRLYVDDTLLVRELAADGFIISTALGSTAYCQSAGGPLVLPTAPVRILTPICPNRPRLKPLVVPIGSKVRIETLDTGKRPLKYAVDGVYNYSPVKYIETMATDIKLKLLFVAGHNPIQHMVDRVLLT